MKFSFKGTQWIIKTLKCRGKENGKQKDGEIKYPKKYTMLCEIKSVMWQ